MESLQLHRTNSTMVSACVGLDSVRPQNKETGVPQDGAYRVSAPRVRCTRRIVVFLLLLAVGRADARSNCEVYADVTAAYYGLNVSGRDARLEACKQLVDSVWILNSTTLGRYYRLVGLTAESVPNSTGIATRVEAPTQRCGKTQSMFGKWGKSLPDDAEGNAKQKWSEPCPEGSPFWSDYLRSALKGAKDTLHSLEGVVPSKEGWVGSLDEAQRAYKSYIVPAFGKAGSKVRSGVSSVAGGAESLWDLVGSYSPDFDSAYAESRATMDDAVRETKRYMQRHGVSESYMKVFDEWYPTPEPEPGLDYWLPIWVLFWATVILTIVWNTLRWQELVAYLDNGPGCFAFCYVLVVEP